MGGQQHRKTLSWRNSNKNMLNPQQTTTSFDDLDNAALYLYCVLEFLRGRCETSICGFLWLTERHRFQVARTERRSPEIDFFLAAKAGNTDTLEWLQSHNCQSSSSVCHTAARQATWEYCSGADRKLPRCLGTNWYLLLLLRVANWKYQYCNELQSYGVKVCARFRTVSPTRKQKRSSGLERVGHIRKQKTNQKIDILTFLHEAR